MPDEAVGTGTAADDDAATSDADVPPPADAGSPGGDAGGDVDGDAAGSSGGATTTGGASTTTTGAAADSTDAGGADTCGDAGCAEDPVCGNGLVERGEACDLGDDNDDEGDCTSTCVTAVCGDGLVHAGVEECDMPQDLDECTASCELCDETDEIGEGPIWNNPDAQTQCPGICAGAGGYWEGAWWTVTPNQFSVCQCLGLCPGLI